MAIRNNAQPMDVVNYLEERGSITRAEGMSELRIANVPAVISVLRDNGYAIRTDEIPFTTIHGKESTYARWILLTLLLGFVMFMVSCTRVKMESKQFTTVGYERIEFETVQKFEHDTTSGYVMIIKDTGTNTEYIVVTHGKSIAITEIGEYRSPDEYNRAVRED